MAVSKKLTMGLTSLAVVTALAVGGGSMAMAEDASTGQTLVDKIAAKFNLSKDEVQAVFDEDQGARQEERLADVSKDLQDAVDDGDITAEQKTLIENKIKEQQTARETEMDALKEWATTNNIDMKYVMGGGRHGADLDDAVEDGDITAEQQALIEAKQDELETAREAARDSLVQWAEDNNIDEQYLHFGMGGPGGRGGGPRGDM